MIRLVHSANGTIAPRPAKRRRPGHSPAIAALIPQLVDLERRKPSAFRLAAGLVSRLVASRTVESA
jgi:hypothetical protein